MKIGIIITHGQVNNLVKCWKRSGQLDCTTCEKIQIT